MPNPHTFTGDPNFFGSISDAFSYFGGTTRIAKSDNMQQWVKKYDRYEPTFNGAFHKGAIRTFGRFRSHFRSFHFNSIKVRLELQTIRLAAMLPTFQFHKGAIRTERDDVSIIITVISIP